MKRTAIPPLVWPTVEQVKALQGPLLSGWFWAVVTHSWTECDRDRLKRTAAAAFLDRTPGTMPSSGY